MINEHVFDLNPGNLRAGKRTTSDMPSREELMKRNSFGSPDDNRHLDKILGVDYKGRRVYEEQPVANKLEEQKARKVKGK